MAGNINEFKASFRKDLARPNKFEVNIPIPLTLIPYIESSRNLNYRCESANLPGRTFATLEQKTYGPVEKYPYLNTYADIDLTFIVDDDMSQKVFFDAWMNFINPMYNYNMRYKGDYATVITINQYDVTNQLSYSVNLYDAYPVSVNPMDLDWSVDGYHKIQVTFAYTYWKNNSLQSLGMELVDAGLAAAASAVGGLGGNANEAIGTSIFNPIADRISNINFNNAGLSGEERDVYNQAGY